MTNEVDLDFPGMLAEAFRTGLREKFGAVVGPMLADVVAYYPKGELEVNRLRRVVQDNGAATLGTIIANRTSGAALRLIRSQMIGSALLADRSAVTGWATEGRNRSAKVGGAWADTAEQWQWALQNTDRYVYYARRVKYFLNQL